MPPSLRYLSSFRTPAQRNRSIAEQMRQEAQRQQELNDQEVKRLQKLMQVETQRQQLLENQESDRTGREFKIEQQRQRQLDGMERLRGVEQRQQPPVQRPRIAAPPVPPQISEAVSTPITRVRADLVNEGLTSNQVELVIDSARKGEDVPPALFVALGKQPGRVQRVLGRSLETATDIASAIDDVTFRVNDALLRFTGAEREERPSREEFGEQFGVLAPRVSEAQAETLRGIPVAGPAVAREAEALTTPLGFGATLAFPGAVAAGAGGGVAAATAAQEAGLSEEAQIIAQILGNILAPGGGIVSPRAVTGPARAGVRGGRELVGEAAARARLAPEAGGRVPTGPLRGGEELPRITGRGVPPPKPPQDPVAKLTEAIKEAKPVRGETAKLQRIALQQKAARTAGALERGRGEEAFIRARAAQRGELPSTEFEAVRGRFTEEEVNSLFEIVRTSDKAVFQGKPFTRVNAGQTLFKVMNGELPTRGEIKLIEEVFGRELAGAIERFRPLRERAWRAFVDALNLPRTLLASFDVSFPLRQGVMTAARHPKEFFTNFPSMFRGGFSEDFARHVDDIIRSDNTLIRMGDDTATVAELAESGGLFRATLGEFGPLTEREEFFLSTLARKIPGVRISERAFVTYGNKLRHDIFKTTLKNWERGGKTITDNEVQGLADLINKLTGRGTLGPANQAAPLLSAGFFAPRFAVSRPQAFLMMFHPQARVRNLAAQEIVTFVGTGLSILGLIKATNLADVEIDPRSSDFGKIRFGETRLDFWGGNIQWARLVGQMITAQRKGLDGLIIPSDRLKVAERFARTKLSPPVGALVDSPLFAGENLIGEQFPTGALGIANEIRKRTVPLAIQDLAEAIVNEGMSGGLAGLAFVGVGAQTFESRAEKRANLFQEKFDRPFTGKVDDYALIASDADFRAAFPLEGEAKDTQEFFTDTADGLRLPEIARSIKQGNTQAGPGFAQAIENYFSTVSSVAARNRFGEDRDVSPEYLAWREIRPEDYLDPTTFLPDWDAYFAVKDEAFSRLDSQLQSAFRKLDVPGVDPGVLVDYQRARDLRGDLSQISKWQGLTPEQSRTLDDFSREVSRRTRVLSEQSGTRLTEKEVAKVLAEQRGEPGLAEFFVAIQSESRRENLRNPEYDAFIGQNKEGLETFYPNLYSLARLERLGVIEEIPTRRGLQPLGLR